MLKTGNYPFLLNKNKKSKEREQTYDYQMVGVGGGMDWELGVCRCKPLHKKWIKRFYCICMHVCSVVSNFLQPHELQHAMPPCPSPTHGVHSNSRPWSRRCHPAISSTWQELHFTNKQTKKFSKTFSFFKKLKKLY